MKLQSHLTTTNGDKPVFQYGMRPTDPNKTEGPKEHKSIGLNGWVRQYEFPFTTKNLEQLYKLLRTQDAGSVSLVLQKVGYDGVTICRPRLVEKYEEFATRPFDELLDRSARDNLDDSSIK
jgi:hypothetical protein